MLLDRLFNFLVDFFEQVGLPVGAEKLLQLASQLASAVQYMHHLGIVHRDIAARNCT